MAKEVKKDVAKTEKKSVAKAAPKKEEPKEKVAKKDYHISRRAEDGKWQVKFAKGQKAIKLFKTQAEAIEYAKTLAENQEGSFTIHKKDGKIRKQKY